MYGEEFRPKVAGKDIAQALLMSNGFNSGYSSDPYSNVSTGLPGTIAGSSKPKRSKLTNREKEVLYDETIKFKMMNN